MDEYIKREEAEKRLSQRAKIANSAYIDQTPCQIMMLAQNVVHLIPSADVAPVRHGRYITDDNGDSSCSECGEWYLDVTKNYCPNCGARLDLEAERW